jgi:hypothetical protein
VLKTTNKQMYDFKNLLLPLKTGHMVHEQQNFMVLVAGVDGPLQKQDLSQHTGGELSYQISHLCNLPGG